MTPVTPRHSATVILLREQAGQTQLLITRRHQDMAFMGGLWVFPGGTLCPADSSEQTLALLGRTRANGPPLTQQSGEALPEIMQQALAMAACRETFEETGVLLASGDAADHCDAQTIQRLQTHREQIVAQPELFSALLAQAGLRPALQRLTYWAHWITPEAQPRRFDTRFFLAVLPPEQCVSLDANEAVEYRWETPATLLAAASGGDIKLSPPTLFNMMDIAHSLQEHGSLAALLASEAQRDIPPVMPIVIRGERVTIVLPWDPEYPDDAATNAARRYPAYLTRLPGRTAGYR